jgi:flagellar biosynthesis/type III secretory pathway chaperone
MINTIWIDNLIKVLDYENKLYKKVLKIAEEKTGIIINGGLENLQETIGKEQRLISELNQLTVVREQILQQIGKSIGKDARLLAVTDFIDILPEEHAKRLYTVRDKLKNTIFSLAAKNELNQKLIRNALEYVDFSLNLLSQPVPQATQYGRKGNEAESQNRRVLDIKY